LNAIAEYLHCTYDSIARGNTVDRSQQAKQKEDETDGNNF